MRAGFASILLAASVAALLPPAPAAAKVTRIEVTATAPFGTFKAGGFVRMELRVSGELSPSAERIAISIRRTATRAAWSNTQPA